MKNPYSGLPRILARTIVRREKEQITAGLDDLARRLGDGIPLPELIADREAIHAAQKEDLKRKTVKVRKSLLP